MAISLDEARLIAREFYEPTASPLNDFWQTGVIRSEDERHEILKRIGWFHKEMTGWKVDPTNWPITTEQELAEIDKPRSADDPRAKKHQAEHEKKQSGYLHQLDALREYIERAPVGYGSGQKPKSWGHLTHLDIFPDAPGGKEWFKGNKRKSRRMSTGPAGTPPGVPPGGQSGAQPAAKTSWVIHQKYDQALAEVQRKLFGGKPVNPTSLNLSIGQLQKVFGDNLRPLMQAGIVAPRSGGGTPFGGSTASYYLTVPKSARGQASRGPLTKRNTMRTRQAKMDLMTGFTGSKPPDLDLGLDGNGYFPKWTTVGLADTGKNSAIDDEQQPTGGGAPETVARIPLKTPMEAEDVTRPKLRESPEASRRKAHVLRKVAMEIRRLDPITARRLMAAADEISYDTLSTASLPEAGDEANEVDDYHDNFGHGTLQFFGTDPAKSTSLTRESSRRRRTATEDFTRCEISFKYPGDNWDKVVCTSKEDYDKKMKEFKEKGAEVKVRHFDNGEVDTNLQYANRGASRRVAQRRTAESGGPGVHDIDMKKSLDLVKNALEGRYDRGAVAHILKADYDRIMGLLKSGHGGQNGQSNMVPGQEGKTPTASRRNRRARAEGDAPLKPEPTVGDQDGPGAEGAGGFVDRSKAPLQETMTAQDVERPKIRENPEAGRLASLWNAFRSELLRQASGTGKWNSGRYAVEARDYGDSVEVQASVVDRENLPMPVGSILFSKISDSPRGRYATVEINDGILENRTTEFTIQRPRQAGLIVRRLVAGVVQTSKDLIDGITV